ncbi:hypothetical protein FNF28_03034 [Cafeteria roenbergensis]|uniref:Ketosynthase family 3 (KS3) domain-containing protein n=1 Tax=Cafeteria roenbergensis TaxID=33653 RepID=A0A5A8DS45_CAFRO|nr:hypothetical protein FNF28_03034 [Cafeteria roenbergensis]
MILEFGGQGYDYLADLEGVWNSPFHGARQLIAEAAAMVTKLAECEPAKRSGYFPLGMDIIGWISGSVEQVVPPPRYRFSAPVSFPLTGLASAARLLAAAERLAAIRRVSVSDALTSLVGDAAALVGHSQGVVIAAVAAASTDVTSFRARSMHAIGLLFFMGLRAQLAAEALTGADPRTRSLRPAVVRMQRLRQQEAGASPMLGVPGGEEPTPMLAVSGMDVETVERFIVRVRRAMAAQRESEVGGASAPDSRREALALSLVNGPTMCVVTGAAEALSNLRAAVTKASATRGDEQARTPHSRRKPVVATAYLPVSAPFHSPVLDPVCDAVLADCEALAPGAIGWSVAEFRTAVIDTSTGEPISEPSGAGRGWLASRLVALTCSLQMNWPMSLRGAAAAWLVPAPGAAAAAEAAAASAAPTRELAPVQGAVVLDFGPGGAHGTPVLTSRLLEGAGAAVVVAGHVPDTDLEPAAGGAGDVVPAVVGSPRGCAVVPLDAVLALRTARDASPLAGLVMSSVPADRSAAWGRRFAPRVVTRASDGSRFLHTRLTALLGRAPIIVGGMTPTTSFYGHRLVAACANAGFTAELAAGGLPRPHVFRQRIARLHALLEPGAAIGVNLLFLNQRQWAFQFPLVLELRRQGVPIDGLTVAAGVPSVEKAQEIVQSLRSSGMRYVAFKPGSVDAIRRVIDIARAVDDFPVIVQWTGGRAGGHHSFEDMHVPILATYAALRSCQNVVLVAGSGFGDADGALPYMTGEWSTRPPYSRAAMPFDGILVASRMMIAREAATAPEVKQLLVDTPGVPADRERDWESSYEADAGGVITVKSELGEPIHKVANRGIRLWRRLDAEFFSLPQAERGVAIAKRRAWVIDQLNANFQKVFFGRKATGEVCGLEEMTYGEVMRRFVDLTFVTRDREHSDPEFHHEDFQGDGADKSGRWLDTTFRSRLLLLLTRCLERLGAESRRDAEALVTGDASDANVDEDPSALVDAFCVAVPSAESHLLHGEDVAYFLQLCRAGGKPVPFVPVVDGELEFWFKKDSLWYSEDLAAVRDRDAGRVCVLQGPVAVRHARVANEPAADILEAIHQGLAERVQAVSGAGGAAAIVETLAWCEHESSSECPFWPTQSDDSGVPLPPWAAAIVSSPFSVRGNAWVPSALPGLFGKRKGTRRVMDLAADELLVVDSLTGRKLLHASPLPSGSRSGHGKGQQSMEARHVRVVLEDQPPATAERPAPGLSPLTLDFTFHPETAWAMVHEPAGTDGGLLSEVRAFYARLWDCPVPEEGSALGECAAEAGAFGPGSDGSWAWPLRVETTCEHLVTREDIEAFCAAVNLPVLMAAGTSSSGSSTSAAGRDASGSSGAAAASSAGSAVADPLEAAAVAKDSIASAPLGLSIVASWQALIAPLLAPSIGGNLLELVHLSHGHEVVEPLASRRVPVREGESVRSRLRISEVRNERAGRVVTCEGIILRSMSGEGWRPWLRLRSRFLFRGTFTDHSGTFSATERSFDMHVKDETVRQVLASKAWFSARRAPAGEAEMPPVGCTLRAKFRTVVEFNAAGRSKSVRIQGAATVVSSVEPPDVSSLGGVRPFEPLEETGDPPSDEWAWSLSFLSEDDGISAAFDAVSAFFERHAQPTAQEMPLPEGKTLTLLAEPDVSRSPADNLAYASASRDLNPIHRNPLVASLAGLPGTITHGMWTSANAQRVLESCIGGAGEGALVRSFNASFEGMVLPGDELATQVTHVAMRAGRRVLHVETVAVATGDVVLRATAEVDQQPTAFVFTGQGSASVGMGMQLFATSSVARGVWEVADSQLRETYGFSLLSIVRENPKSLTIHFGGRRGAAIRRNFQQLGFEDASGAVVPLLPQITDDTDEHTFSHPEGLLFATQFTQPALVITEKAAFEDMRARGVLPRGFLLAGHSLGEYAALSAAAPLLRTEDLVELVFLRGLVMQNAVPRDAQGRSDFAMLACNPQRVASGFSEAHLQRLVSGISALTGKLLQIVNNNVEDWQYVCTGHITALRALSLACDAVHADPSAALASPEGVVKAATKQARVEEARAHARGEKPRLDRGRATIPLPGIDVPFHSRFLLSGVPSFRACLAKAITLEGTARVLPSVLHRYVPNLVAMPFELSPRFVAVVHAVTKSPMLEAAASAIEAGSVSAWNAATADRTSLGRSLLLELMAFQFASPVQWINTQRHFFTLPADNVASGEGGGLGGVSEAELAAASAVARVVTETGTEAALSARARTAAAEAISKACSDRAEAAELMARIIPSRFRPRLPGGVAEPGVRAVVEVGPAATLARMALRSLASGRYGNPASRRVLFYGRDEDRDSLLFDGEDAGATARAFAEARRAQKAEEAAVAITAAVPPADGAAPPQAKTGSRAPAAAPAPQAEPAVAARAPEAARPAAASVPDAPLGHLLSMRTLVAVRAGLGLDNVQASKSLKDVCAGKSALQNEIMGELEKEFAGAGSALEGAEELPMADLAAKLAGALPGYGASGPGAALAPLVNKLGSAKLPGGFGLSSARSYLRGAWGLGEGRSEAVLVVALAEAPPQRLSDESQAHAWLDACVASYSRECGVALSKGSASGGTAAGAGGSGDLAALLAAAGPGAQEAIMSALAGGAGGSDRGPTGGLARLAEDSAEAWASYLAGGKRDRTAEAASRQVAASLREAEARLASIEAEHGPAYEDGVKPAFEAQKVRTFTSYWNWASLDLMEALYGSCEPEGAASEPVGRALAESLANRSTSQLVRIAEAAAAAGSPAAAAVVPSLRERHLRPPVFRPTFAPSMPVAKVDAAGRTSVAEVPRPGQASAEDYAASVGAVEAGADLPLLCVRRLSSHDVTLLGVDDEATAVFLRALRRAAQDGVTFQGKTALITGCGRGSIGAELVAALLQGGARVVATTSRLNRQSASAFQALFERFGARGASLTLVPFNQASRVDVDALVSHVYGSLGMDLDFVVPFAAIGEAGRTLSTLDDKSELAHRIMLTNTLRLLGAVVEAKRSRGIETRPALAVLPLSPNHGVFGGDGLYAESKLGLESLMRKWSAEGWDAYLSVAGASIGWTRGTGLMSDNDVVAAGIEGLGCRTFSQNEMALNIVAVMSQPVARMAAEAPIWADLRGGMQRIANLKGEVDGIRQGLKTQASVARAVASDAELDVPPVDQKHQPAPTVERRSNWTGARFPDLPEEHSLGLGPLPVGMADLDSTVVVVGFGEVGPWGSSRTRWEVECRGTLSLEGVIELAWLTGKIRFHTGPLDPQAAAKAPWKLSEAERRAYAGWVDAASGAPVRDWDVKPLYEADLLEHCGVRVIEPEMVEGYEPAKKRLLRQVAIGRDMPWVEISSPDEADDYRLEAGDDRVEVRQRAADGAWEMRLLAGASVSMARALRFDRWVAGQIPTGWDARRCGVPSDLASRIDRVTLFALASAAEALIGSGLTDPYELYSYCHVSEVGSTVGGGMGGMKSLRQVFRERFTEGEMPSDALQETFINTTAAWINMLLLSSAGPIKTVVGACATAAESVDVAVDTIQSGKARVVLCGGTDDFGEEGSYEFASMGATSSSTKELAMAREPSEMSRPMAASRGGFMEAQGAGIQVLMQARLAIALGAPIHAVLALTSTATDKEGRSVPAPGQGILTTAREAALPGARAAAVHGAAAAAQAAGDAGLAASIAGHSRKLSSASEGDSGDAADSPQAADARDLAAGAAAASGRDASHAADGSVPVADNRSVASTLRGVVSPSLESDGDSGVGRAEAALLARLADATSSGSDEDVARAWAALRDMRLAKYHPMLAVATRRERLVEDLRLAAVAEQRRTAQLRAEEAGRATGAASSLSAAGLGARWAALREETAAATRAAMRRWCGDTCCSSPHVAPLRAALARWGLTPDDVAVASFHGTGTKANDTNESEVTNAQMTALGRTPGRPVLVVAQKGLTGHPKGAAAAWMLNGLMQCMADSVVPGNRNLDDVEPKLRAFTHLVYPNRSVKLRPARAGMPAVPAAIMKSFGFGQAGAEVLVVHPHVLLQALPPPELAAYAERRARREAAAYRYYQDVLLGQADLIAVKSAPPFAAADEQAVYLDSMARATQDPVTKQWLILPGRSVPEAGAGPAQWVGPQRPTDALTWLGEASAGAAGAGAGAGAASGVAEAPSAEASLAGANAAKDPPTVATTRSDSAAADGAASSGTAEPAEGLEAAACMTSVLEAGAAALTEGEVRIGARSFIGVDVEPVVTLAAAPESMLARNFTQAERVLCAGRPDPMASLAGRWAAKEAVFKALSSCPGGPVSKGAGAALIDVEVISAGNGAPRVVLHGDVESSARAAGVSSVRVTISHAAGLAVAQAIVSIE